MHNEEDVKIVTMIAGGLTSACRCRGDTCDKLNSICSSKGICIASVIRKYLPTNLNCNFDSDEDSLNTMMYVLYILSANMADYNCFTTPCKDCAWFDESTQKCIRIKIRQDYKYLYSLRSHNGI